MIFNDRAFDRRVIDERNVATCRLRKPLENLCENGAVERIEEIHD